MTDTVNVPRDVLEQLVAWINREVPVPTRSAARWAIDLTGLLAAAPTAEPVDVEEYLKEAISSSPQPLQDLGEFLSSVLDEDHWKTADRLMLAIATSHPEAPKVEQEPVAWLLVNGNANSEVITREHPGEWPNAHVYPLYRHPAPASDELLEALKPICREADCWPELADDDVLSFATPEGRASPYDIKMGDIRRIALIAKHKGPQS